MLSRLAWRRAAPAVPRWLSAVPEASAAPQPPAEPAFQFEIHAGLDLGAVIGPRGTKIKKIMKQSGARIRVVQTSRAVLISSDTASAWLGGAV